MLLTIRFEDELTRLLISMYCILKDHVFLLKAHFCSPSVLCASSIVLPSYLLSVQYNYNNYFF